MTDEDVKKISKALDERLKPLVGELARVKSELLDSKVTQLRQYAELSRIGKDIARIDSTLETINEEIQKHGKKLDTLWDQVIEVTEGLEDVKETLKSLTDILKQTSDYTKDNSRKLAKRVIEVEEHLGIVPPPELTTVD